MPLPAPAAAKRLAEKNKANLDKIQVPPIVRRSLGHHDMMSDAEFSPGVATPSTGRMMPQSR